MALSFMALIVFAIPLPCLLGLAWLWYRVLRTPKEQHAVCGHCQYIVEGLQTMFCPECGSDFRKVGIGTPGKRGQIEPVRFLVLWTVLLAPLVLIVSGLAIALGPQRVTALSTVSLSPKSHSFGHVELRFRGAFTAPKGFGGTRPLGIKMVGSTGERMKLALPKIGFNRVADVIELTISAASKPMPSARTLSVSPGSGAYRYTNAEGRTVDQAQGFSQAVMEDWFAVFGLTPDVPGAGADAAELFALVNAHAQGQVFFTTNGYRASGFTNSVSRSGPVGWVLGGVLVFWLLVYVGGIVLYYRRRRLRHATQAAVAVA